MAEKRMFSNKVIGSDSFLEMPDSTQNLYFHLSMYADDDGFVDKPKSIMRMTGKKEDDLKLLIAKSFVIPFDSGILVIRHWRLNNYLRMDRYKETQYLEEKAKLTISPSGEYELGRPDGIPVVTIDKNRIEKNSINDVALTKEEEPKQPPHDSAKIKEIIAYLNEKLGTRYSASSKKSTSHISARLNEGNSVEDFKLVIDQKYKDWFNTEYAEYLRPETLFGTKFESYLNKAIMNKPKQQNKEIKVDKNGVISI